MRKLFYSLSFILFCSCLFLSNAQSLRRTDKNADFFIPTGAFKSAKKIEKLPTVEQMQYQGEQAPVIIEIEQEKLAQQKTEKERLEKEKRKEYIEKKALEQMQKSQLKEKTEKIIEKQKVNTVKEEILKPEIIEEPTFQGYEQIIYEYNSDLEKISKGLPVQNPRLEQMISDFNEEAHTVE